MFIDDAVEREMNAVHQEHDKNLQSDQWRIDRVFNSECNPKHPLTNFGTGNKETLNIENIRDILMKFHKSDVAFFYWLKFIFQPKKMAIDGMNRDIERRRYGFISKIQIFIPSHCGMKNQV